MTSGDSRWELTAEALESLLGFLDRDRERAAERYETVRCKLIRLFEWRGCSFPEELADETINRVAHKLAAGTEIRSEDPYRYFVGVAHLVFHEVLRTAVRERAALAEVRHQPPPEPLPEETERRLHCLDLCLAELAPADRDLIVEFHRGRKGVRIAHRKRLAAQLAISVNALRIRAHRLRVRLEACVVKCLQESEAG